MNVAIGQYCRSALCALSVLCASPAGADDTADSLRKGLQAPAQENGGYLEVGILAGLYVSPLLGIPESNTSDQIHPKLGLNLNGRYQYEGAFLEAYFGSLEGLTLGYNFWQSDAWVLDLVGLREHGPMNERASRDYKDIEPRRGDFTLGLRTTYTHADYILQSHLLTDVSGTHGGHLFSWKFGRNWLVSNWNLHAVIGATYRSSAVTDYYYSQRKKDFPPQEYPVDVESDELVVESDESDLEDDLILVEGTEVLGDEDFSLPAPLRGGWVQVFEVGASFPINEKWVFRSFYRFQQLPGHWQRSMFFVGDHHQELMTSISYVF
jgi:MipA family protein